MTALGGRQGAAQGSTCAADVFLGAGDANWRGPVHPHVGLAGGGARRHLAERDTESGEKRLVKAAGSSPLRFVGRKEAKGALSSPLGMGRGEGCVLTPEPTESGTLVPVTH